jgi:hypothetical protein
MEFYIYRELVFWLEIAQESQIALKAKNPATKAAMSPQVFPIPQLSVSQAAGAASVTVEM